MSILFFVHPDPNYVPDLLLHGFRKIIGPDAVEFPRKDCLYSEVVGFVGTPDKETSPRWFPSDDGKIDRDDIFKKVAKGYFQYILCDVRVFSKLQENLTKWPHGLVVIDGEDVPVSIPIGPYAVCRRETDGMDFSIPLPMAMPEEIIDWIASFDGEAKTHSVGFLGGIETQKGERGYFLEALRRRYDDCLLKSYTQGGRDMNPPGQLGRGDYYRYLQQCRVVLNLKGAGCDTFRFWENAACNAVHVSQRMQLLIPNDFIEKRHLFRFADKEELFKTIDRILDGAVEKERIIAASREHLRLHHTTGKRATYLLDRLKPIFS
jgi:hypothetical protein